MVTTLTVPPLLCWSVRGYYACRLPVLMLLTVEWLLKFRKLKLSFLSVAPENVVLSDLKGFSSCMCVFLYTINVYAVLIHEIFQLCFLVRYPLCNPVHDCDIEFFLISGVSYASSFSSSSLFPTSRVEGISSNWGWTHFNHRPRCFTCLVDLYMANII